MTPAQRRLQTRIVPQARAREHSPYGRGDDVHSELVALGLSGALIGPRAPLPHRLEAMRKSAAQRRRRKVRRTRE